MTHKPFPIEPEYLACQICLEEIPESAGNNHEADEYTQHFCGIECYSVWKKVQTSNLESE